MQALVLNDDHAAQAATAMALFKRNFQVVTADDVEMASQYADLGVFDLVVMAERVKGRLSHAVALSAELRNPDVTTMVMTPRNDEDVDELFELLPSLYCLLGEELAPELVARMAVSGVVGSLSVADRGRPARIDAAVSDEVAKATECPGMGFETGNATGDSGKDSAAAGIEAPRQRAAEAPLPAHLEEEYSPVMAEIIARARARLSAGGDMSERLPGAPASMAGAEDRKRETAAA